MGYLCKSMVIFAFFSGVYVKNVWNTLSLNAFFFFLLSILFFGVCADDIIVLYCFLLPGLLRSTDCGCRSIWICKHDFAVKWAPANKRNRNCSYMWVFISRRCIPVTGNTYMIFIATGWWTWRNESQGWNEVMSDQTALAKWPINIKFKTMQWTFHLFRCLPKRTKGFWEDK